MDTGRFAVPAAVRDWAIAVGVAATLLIAGWSGDAPGTAVDLAGSGLLLAAGLVLVVRRRAPVVALVLTGLCTVGYQAVGYDVPAVAFLFAVYAGMRAGHRIITVVAAGVMLAALPLVALAPPIGLPIGEALRQARGTLELAWLVAAGAAGEALRQAERRADEAERTREETALRRAHEERLHMARELHDSLTHQISVITVQAGVAVHLARKRGERVPEALLAIQQAGGEAARELRATLEGLRDDGAAPTHGLTQVPELMERVRMIGLESTFAIEGQPHDLPLGVERAAYRVIQESLTNIARHASATRVSVRIGYGPSVLAIQVDDDGVATPETAGAPGIGLRGMRERITALGGRFDAGPRGEGGFTVHAELPVGPVS